MTFATSYAAISWASAATSAPSTTALTLCCNCAPSVCAAAIASIELLLAIPPLCSIKTSIPLLIQFICVICGLKNPRFDVQLLRQLSGARFRIAIAEHLRLFSLLRQVDLLDTLV